MSQKIKSQEFPGIYYVQNGKKSVDWIYYCKFRYLGKLYNFRNLSKEFGVRSAKEANSKMEWIKEEARKSLELGLPNPLERKKIKELQKSKIIEEKVKRTIEDRWKYEIANYKSTKRPNTIKQYEKFYNNYIGPYLGKKKSAEIKTKDIDMILVETNLAKQSDPYKSLLKRLLRPIMAKAIADGEITSSVLEVYKFKLKLIPNKQKISQKTKLQHLEISKKLFIQIPKYISQYKAQREEWQQLMYLQLMCGRRYGELFELTSENIDYKNKRINLQAKITKSKINTSFPIPEECQEFILSIKHGKIFKEISMGSYYMVFQRMKKMALEDKAEDKDKAKDKEEEDKLNFKLTAHDTRSLFISSLVELGEDSKKVDYMLDHKPKIEETINFYLDLSEESCTNAFKKYWEALRT